MMMNPEQLLQEETQSMSRCIPMLSMTGTFLSKQVLPLKGKWGALRQRRLNVTELSVRDAPQPVVTPALTSWSPDANIDPAMQGHQGGGGGGGEKLKQPWSSSVAPPEGRDAYGADDEMLSWLHYPIEDHLERGYGSEIFGDVPSSGSQPRFTGGVGSRIGDAEAAMALGAERAAGLRSQVGLEAFCKVRTSIQPPVPRWPTMVATEAGSSQEVLAPVVPPSLPLPLQLPSSKTVESVTSFPHFSVLNKPVLGLPTSVNVVSSSLGGESVASYHRKEIDVGQMTSPKTEAESFMSVGGSSSWKTKSADNDSSFQRKTSPAKKRYESAEPTITSSSGGSENTYELAVLPAEKRKAAEMTDSVECQSEELLEAESSDVKKQTSGRPKRSRAAEVHNLSERRRRDRINEKMRALQELIPNSNKTDKASMLDEAIEYLKMLRLQLQMMSMRTGINVPPMVMSSGLQPMQVSPMAAMPYGVTMGMGIGMNMSMGMGMNMIDMSSGGSSGRSMQGVSAASLGEVSDPPQQTFHPYVPHQQLPLQLINRDMYNAYMLPLAQQQQQHNPQVQQQQQQQPLQQMQMHPNNAFQK